MYEHIYEFCRKDDTVFFPAYFVPDNVRNDPFVREIRSSAIAILIGDVLTSASPIESIGGRLLILESEPDLPNDYVALINDDRYRCRSTAYTPAEIDTLQSVLDKEFSRETPENVTVYNVGQGYCASITMKSGIAVFSDIGLSTNPQELSLPEVDSAKRQIAKVIPTAVVLSHWDMDHILGVTNADDAIYDAVWIVPDIYTLKNSIKTYPNFISTSAKRLLKYLDWKNSNKLIRISDRFVRAMLYQNSTQTFSIWTGERRSVSKKNRKNENFTITAANNFGLMLFLGAKVTALLPGDCEYGVFPDLLYSKGINYLVAPHHCSRMSNPRIMPATQGKKSAILTYGRYNSYGHPNQTHLEDLQNLGYEIIPIEPVPARILPL